jgi:hypothetical protein
VPSNYKSVPWAKYEALSTDNPTSIVWASNGGEGSGKSYFGLTAPGPIFVAAFDAYGMNRVGAEVKRGKDIRVSRYAFNPQAVTDVKLRAKAAAEIWDRFVQEYREALLNARTVLWDREDLAWELLRFASFGDMSAAPREYNELNTEYTSLVQEAFAAKVNLGLLRGLREKWISKFDPGKGKMVPNATGEMIPDGMKRIPDHVDIVLNHRWSDTDAAYLVKIDKFPNKEFRGLEVPLTFPEMACAAYPDTTEEDWTAAA